MILPPPVHKRTGTDAGFWAAALLTFAAACITVGIIWDISWHITIGRDTFWTPAHMAIYLGGALGGCIGGWLAIWNTFIAKPDERMPSVKILGAYAPMGAWLAIWGAAAMLISGPFDDWWHNAYGLDVKIISPPHVVLGLGMFGISVAALLLTLALQNQQLDKRGGALFMIAGGIFLALGAVFIMEFSYPNMQHSARFYGACAYILPFRLIALGRAGRTRWAATKIAAIFMLIECLMIWILPLFAAQPKLAPIFNPVTHMVPPIFPILLIFPALAIDLVLQRAGHDEHGWRRVLLAMTLGAIFFAVLLLVQWYFAEFLLSPKANNWFFAGNRFWGYRTPMESFRFEFWRTDYRGRINEPLQAFSIMRIWLVASVSAWIGLLWGGWMRKVKR